MNEKENIAVELPAVVKKPLYSYGLKINETETLPFCVCPFCFVVYNMHPSRLKDPSAKCSCGATFSALGLAAKLIESEVKP